MSQSYHGDGEVRFPST